MEVYRSTGCLCTIKRFEHCCINLLEHFYSYCKNHFDQRRAMQSNNNKIFRWLNYKLTGSFSAKNDWNTNKLTVHVHCNIFSQDRVLLLGVKIWSKRKILYPYLKNLQGTTHLIYTQGDANKIIYLRNDAPTTTFTCAELFRTQNCKLAHSIL